MPTANIVAVGGKTGDGSVPSWNGGAGTIYLMDRAKTNGDLILDNNGITTTQVTTISGGTYAHVTVTGGAIVAMNGGIATDGDLQLDDSKLTLAGDLSLPGDLTLNNSQLTIAGALSVVGNLNLANNSILTHPGATVSSQYRLAIQAANIVIDGTSKIDVSSRGYLGGWRGGNNSGIGMTKNLTTNVPTTVGGSAGSNGGSYGGLGGLYSTWNVNALYGDVTYPDESGSGGGGHYAWSSYLGGNGGGLVKITAGTLTVDGSILADGGSPPDWNGGGGSGGGVLLNILTLAGGGTISAKGGAGIYNAGSGGGGRIAVYYETLTLPTANIVAAGGLTGDGSVPSWNGSAGTIFYQMR